jgi:hypothetical protein
MNFRVDERIQSLLPRLTDDEYGKLKTAIEADGHVEPLVILNILGDRVLGDGHNRIIWGASDVKELRIRHTGGAPERFAYEGSKYLRRYAEESTAKLADGIKAAQNRDVVATLNTGKGDTVESWLQSRGFTKAQAKGSVETAVAEQGGARSLWDIVNGVTAYARSVTHTDERVQLETRAGKLMELVA